MALSWLKAASNAFTFKTLLRHYCHECESVRSRFQPGESPSRGLPRDSTTSPIIRLQHYPGPTVLP